MRVRLISKGRLSSPIRPKGANFGLDLQGCRGLLFRANANHNMHYPADRSRIASGGSALAHAWHDLLEPWHSFHAWCHARAAAPAILFLFLTTKQ